MHYPLILLLLLLSLSSFAKNEINNHKDNKKVDHNSYKSNPYCIFDVIALNSPVKDSVARFLLKTPKNFEIDEVSFQVKNAGKFFEKPKNFQKINLVDGPQGKEIKIDVSKLPSGFYRLLVKVKDKKRKEHSYKNKYRDSVSFKVEKSIQVPMPDEEVNNSTLQGVDIDKNGIRDDVQLWIENDHKDKPLEMQNAFKLIAVQYQNSLITHLNKEKSITAGHELLRAMNCYRLVSLENGFDHNFISKKRKELSTITINSKIRLDAKLNANSNFHGQTSTAVFDKDLVCD